MLENVDLVIVGAGAAGPSAALYAARARLSAVTIERMGTGGQLINVDGAENYPGFPDPIGGYDLGPRFAEQAMNAGARIEYGEFFRDREVAVIGGGGAIHRADVAG